jgi:voltage-gated potassium channel Kch
VYLILGLLWGLAYTLVAQINANAFELSAHPGTAATMSGFTSIYFSFSTLATLGYGDLTPATDVARMLAMLEAMTGTLFVGVMIARLVCLYSASEQTRTIASDRGQNHHK